MTLWTRWRRKISTLVRLVLTILIKWHLKFFSRTQTKFPFSKIQTIYGFERFKKFHSQLIKSNTLSKRGQGLNHFYLLKSTLIYFLEGYLKMEGTCRPQNIYFWHQTLSWTFCWAGSYLSCGESSEPWPPSPSSHWSLSLSKGQLN